MSDPGPPEPIAQPADPWLGEANTEATPVPPPVPPPVSGPPTPPLSPAAPPPVSGSPEYAASPTSSAPAPMSLTDAAPDAPPPPRASLARIIGTLVALGVVLLAAGGVAIALAVSNAQPRGAAEPKLAVEGYLSATFFTKNADDARGFLCEPVRDDPGTDQVIKQIKDLDGPYEQPRVSWTYPAVTPQGREASADVTLTLTTANEQTSTRRITVLLVEDRGWWVCDIQPA